MAASLTRLAIRNYRALADVQIDLRPINVLFGPNAAGKSTLLDSLWFVRDCALRGCEKASSSRSHGIGLLWDGAHEDDGLSITLGTDELEYRLGFSFASGRIEPFPAEQLLLTSEA